MLKKAVLSNGIRLVVKKIAGTNAVTCLVLVGAGSRYENPNSSGISHFLEHIFFKGAKKYRDTKQVSEAIDNVGGDFNAFTGKEYAGYYVKVASKHADIAGDVLSDMLLHARFEKEEIEKERGVILEEFNMYQDMPVYQITWDFERLIYGDQPMGWDQIGTKELIKKFQREDFVNYKKALYTPDNIVISIAGNIDFEEAKAFAEKYFADLSGKKSMNYEKLGDFAAEKIYLRNKKTEQAHLVLGVPAVNISHPDYYAASILAILLGGNMSSRMFLNVRESKGLAYYISTQFEDFSDSGLFYTRAGVDISRIELATTAILEEYKKVIDQEVPKEELNKCKEYLKGKMILHLEDSEEYAHFLGKKEFLLGKIDSIEEIFAKIDAVKIIDLKNLAGKIFKEEKLKMAVIGPYDNEERFSKLLHF